MLLCTVWRKHQWCSRITVGFPMAAKCILTPDYEDEGKEESREVREVLSQQSTYVKLNVGGALFTTTIGTLTKYDNMLRAMFSGRMDVQTDEQGISSVVMNSEIVLLHLPNTSSSSSSSSSSRMGIDWQKWEAFRCNPQFSSWWLRVSSRQEKRVHGDAGWGQVSVECEASGITPHLKFSPEVYSDRSWAQSVGIVSQGFCGREFILALGLTTSERNYGVRLLSGCSSGRLSGLSMANIITTGGLFTSAYRCFDHLVALYIPSVYATTSSRHCTMRGWRKVNHCMGTVTAMLN